MTKAQRQLFGAEYAAFLAKDGEPVNTLTLDATKAHAPLTFISHVDGGDGFETTVHLTARPGEVQHKNVTATLLNQALLGEQGLESIRVITKAGGKLSVTPHGACRPSAVGFSERLSEHIKAVLDSVP